MPIHVACRYCPDNEEIIGMLVEANPFALRSRTKMGNLVQKKSKSPSPSLLNNEHNQHLVLDGTTSASYRHSLIKTTAELRFEERSIQLRDGSYPLHMAIASGAPQPVLEMLLREAPDVISLKDKFGRTCLHVAVADGRTVDAMVDATITRDGVTDTHLDGNHPVVSVEVVELLHSLDTNQIKTQDTIHQNLPLHTACFGGCSVDVAKCMVKAYPEAIHVKNKEGMRPLDVALASGKCSEDVVYLLGLCEEADVEV